MFMTHFLLLVYATISYGKIVLDSDLTILYFPAGLWEMLF
jgi:hypothetical protein